MLIEIGDVSVLFVLVGVDDAVGSKCRRAAIRVMHDDDIFDAKKMLCNRDRTERIYGAAACNDDLEERGSRGDLVAPRVGDDFAGVDLAQLPSDCRGNANRAWVIAVDDERS